MKTLIRFLMVVIGIIIGWYGHALYEESGKAAITSFEKCVAAGNPVMESYPRQCRTPGGENFTEPIGPSSASITDLIFLDTPTVNQGVTSPIYISGRARGNWYFEASFPVELRDERGIVLAQAPAQAQGEWMTTELVPFLLELSFAKPTTTIKATLVLKKDNPSGLPEHDAQIEIPVVLIP
ncbi:MAG TPA: Gmad2 immunoglobulin-like domain-containing protein [Candidatus Paceibacterota bacterium]